MKAFVLLSFSAVLAIGCSSKDQSLVGPKDPTISVLIYYKGFDYSSLTHIVKYMDTAIIKWETDSLFLRKGSGTERTFAKGTKLEARFDIVVSEWDGWAWNDSLVHQKVYYVVNTGTYWML